MNNQRIEKRKTGNPLRELFGTFQFRESTKTILKELRKNESKLTENDINELDKKIKHSATKRFLKR